MLVRYFTQISILEDTGANDGRLAYAIDNEGQLWCSINMKTGDPSTVWQKCPDLPQP